ncbi:MAG: hypothetical protein ACLVCW_06240 [Campylobacter sp.]
MHEIALKIKWLSLSPNYAWILAFCGFEIAKFKIPQAVNFKILSIFKISKFRSL